MIAGPVAQRRAARVVALLLLLMIAVAGSVPVTHWIGDPDFFWHLKTGDWIWEHRRLPHQVLFSLTAPAAPDAGPSMIDSYWVVEVAYHLLHAAAGMAGIAALRLVLLLLLVGSLFLRREGKDPLVFLGTTLLVVLALRFYLFERPQIFSFVCFSFLLLLLDRIRAAPASGAGPRAAAIALPGLMLFWANSHGAFVLGQATIAAYLVLEGVKYAHPSLRPLPRDRYRLLLLAGAAAAAAALVNPNTWHTIHLTRLPAWMTADNVEYLSSIDHFLLLRQSAVVVYWVLLAFAALSAALAGRSDITRVAVVAITGYLSWTHVRHVLFFLLAAAPFIEGVLSRERFRRTAGAAVVAAALAAGLLLVPGDVVSLPAARYLTRVNPISYPEDAADFVERAGLRGNLYNFSNWGGYLLWRLYPAKVFMDGRNSVEAVSRANELVEQGAGPPAPGARPLWKTILATHGVRYAVLPIFNPTSGDVLPLTFTLLADASWVPVYAGLNSLVFVASGPDNAAVIARHAIPKASLLGALVEKTRGFTRTSPAYLPARLALGDLLAGAGRTEEAVRAYEEALALVPGHPVLTPKLARLRAILRRRGGV